MKMCNKIQQTVMVGTHALTTDVRNVTLIDGVMKGRVRVHTPDSTTRREIPVRCITGHRVWLPVK